MSVNERQGNTRLHFPHVKSLVDLEKSVTHVFDGLYRFRQPEQVVTAGTLRHVIHNLVPHPATPANYFDEANTYTDVPLPTTMHSIDQLDLHLRLNNTNDTSANNFESLPSNLFSRMEVHVGDEIKDTVTDLDQWFDQVVYRDYWEHERTEDSTLFDPSNHVVDSTVTTAADSASGLIRIPLNSTYLTKCGIAPATCNKPIKLRFYSQVSSNVLKLAGATVRDLKVRAREVRGRTDLLHKLSSPHLDSRFLKPKIEQKTLSLTDGQTTEWTLNNFTGDDLCSHMWLIVRASGFNGAARDTMADGKISHVWLENESGENMTNGIQWDADELLTINYPDKFPNNAHKNQGVYLIYCPATDPYTDYREGTMSGAQPLAPNMKLKITAAATESLTFTVVAMCHKHCRVQDGAHIIQ